MRAFVFIFALLASRAWPQTENGALLEKAVALALEGRASEATEALYSALSREDTDKTLEKWAEGLKDIMDRNTLRDFEEEKNKGQFLVGFLKRLDPTPQTRENERIVDHYRRRDYAMRHFASSGTDTYDDRGSLYVRYGKPAVALEVPGRDRIRQSITWVYTLMDEDIPFHFILKGGEFMAADDIRDIVQKAAASEAETYQLLQPRRHLHPAYEDAAARLVEGRVPESLSRITPSDKDNLPNRLLGELASLEGSLKAGIPYSVYSVSRPAPLETKVMTARFPGPDSTRVDVIFMVPPPDADLKLEQDFIVQYQVFGIEGEPAAQGNRRFDTLNLAATANGLVGILPVILPAGSYRMALHIEEGTTGAFDEKEMALQVAPGKSGILALSDILLASQAEASPGGGSAFHRGNLRIVPNPDMRISSLGSAVLYFEISGLGLDRQGLAWYEISTATHSETTGFIKQISPFMEKKSNLKETIRRRNEGSHIQEVLFMNARKLNPGRFRITVQVKDLTNGRKASSQVWLEVR